MIKDLNKKLAYQSTHTDYLRQLEQEKIKLARELHDTALQEQVIALRELDALLGSPILLDKLELRKKIMRIREQQASSIYMLRDFCQTQYAPRLAEGELKSQLEFLLDRLQLRTNIEIDYLNSWPEDGLGGERALHVYRIIQELLHNTEKHAEAKHVKLQLYQDQRYYLLDYSDDGIGMERIDLVACAKFGLKGIYSRAECLHADLKFVSAKQSGFQCMLRIPIAAYSE